ncbi:hexosaminidase D [Gastrophryne carolinensis]
MAEARNSGAGATFDNTLVHLDLKGAPPKVSYLAEVIPLISRLGASGLLVEYEDTFPYDGELLPLRAAHAYSPQEIGEILQLAHIHQLEVIPLIQTFGHMEFVLKHEQFSHLREVPTFPNSLNPHKDQSLRLLRLMIGQVMALHPAARCLHIGADEVYYLGKGAESDELLRGRGLSVTDIFLSHLRNVAGHVTSSYPGVRVIAWDDMLRDADPQSLKDSGVSQLLEPMIWDYTPTLDVDGKTALIERYRGGGFRKIWLAGAFKGATGSCQQLTLIGHHLENLQGWQRVRARIPPGIIQGLALTGWQRYDHFAVLCELLPVGMPSLAVCLQTLKHGSFSDHVMESVRNILGMPHLDTENYMSEVSGSFPGSEVLELVTAFTFCLRFPTKEFLDGNKFVDGWFSHFHRRRRLLHPIMAQHIQPQALSLVSRWEAWLVELRAALLRIFPPITAEEWMEENATPLYLQLQQLVDDLNSVPGL